MTFLSSLSSFCIGIGGGSVEHLPGLTLARVQTRRNDIIAAPTQTDEIWFHYSAIMEHLRNVAGPRISLDPVLSRKSCNIISAITITAGRADLRREKRKKKTPKCVLFCINSSPRYCLELILQHLPKRSRGSSPARIS